MNLSLPPTYQPGLFAGNWIKYKRPAKSASGGKRGVVNELGCGVFKVRGRIEKEKLLGLNVYNFVISSVGRAIWNNVPNAQGLIFWHDIRRRGLERTTRFLRNDPGPKMFLDRFIPPGVDIPTPAMVAHLNDPGPNVRGFRVDFNLIMQIDDRVAD